MEAVQSFNHEMTSLYEVKPPISKAKMTAITKGAIRLIIILFISLMNPSFN
jgi:hypothetical protein